MKKLNVRWLLVAYDLLILCGVELLLLFLYRSNEIQTLSSNIWQALITFLCVFAARYFGGVYRQVWRYGGIQCYIRLLLVDVVAFVFNFGIENLMPIHHLTFARLISISSMNLLGALAIRMVYRYAYKCNNTATPMGKLLELLLRVFAGQRVASGRRDELSKTKLAIIGAGRVGVTLAEDLLGRSDAAYLPRCFVDRDPDKAGREIHGIPVIMENEAVYDLLKELEVEEIALAVLDSESRKTLYERYSAAGYKIKVYDDPLMSEDGRRPALREVDLEELLFRAPIVMQDEIVSAYYRDKVILITGGGGSIGSELCRQLAKTAPKQIIVLDIYENSAYDLQQELKMQYGAALDLRVEIASITNKRALSRVFSEYAPQIVINAAAHKHVPLMETNCIEAVENNVFGTLNLVELCEEFGTERFMMVSTDKAVNPTNVMGATKRMCEMIVQAMSTCGRVKYSTTRFGNVLGSAGSVIPLFRRQIAQGGPVTVTDKRIIRYFMTIPEASQLVLQSGAMAKNGELFVLDMGEPVKILDLAENLIRLSGAKGIEIVETGLRQGEKLYEELLVKTDDLDKTENELIFIERETPPSWAAVEEKLALLRKACDTDRDEDVRQMLKRTVETYKSPEEVNAALV
ncbi:MAG: polysaccharide biosynthesis protein [Oscillospiraceae bacterium]|nr:polysaccharide biosynthesis protein [Oscillospiraceae bacterium]